MEIHRNLEFSQEINTKMLIDLPKYAESYF